MTLENQALHLEVERLRAENAFLRGQLDAVRQVLIERGLDEGAHAGLVPARVERAIVGLVMERDEARGEAAHLRAELASLETYANRITGHRVKLRSVMGLIQVLAEDLCLRDGAPATHAIDAAAALDQILELAAEVLATTGEGGGA